MTHAVLAPPVTPYPAVYDDGSYVFDFMVRRADGGETRGWLGLGVVHNDGDAVLTVQDLKPGGAIAAWNKQCANSPAAIKTVIPGDKILKINSATDPQSMLAECYGRTCLLRLTMARASQADVARAWQQPQTADVGASENSGWLASAAPNVDVAASAAVVPNADFVPQTQHKDASLGEQWPADTSATSPAKWNTEAPVWPPSSLRANASEFVPGLQANGALQ